MLWSDASDLTSKWDATVKAEIAAGGTHLLGFNGDIFTQPSKMD